MQLRPVDEKLVFTCFNNKFCTDCEMRLGCPIRCDFYHGDDFSSELRLQAAEISASETFPGSENFCYELANNLRNKRLRELAENPFFSFT